MGQRVVQLGLIVATCLLVSPKAGWGPPARGDAFTEQAILRASDAQTFDQFGDSVAISEDNAIIGASRENDDAGAAYVFGRDEGGASNWGEVVKLTASDAQAGDFFGDAVAISGDSAIVGALGEDGGLGDPTLEAGAAYVFEFVQGFGWLGIVKPTASDAQPGDSFGRSVAISGDTAIVGAGSEDGGPGDPAMQAGAAYIFGRDEGGDDNWGEIAKLTAGDAQAGDRFGGRSVAISGGTAIVGAHFEDGGVGDLLPDSGAAYVFGFVEGLGWLQIEKLTASDAQTNDQFGVSVAISGDTAIVGAPLEDGGPGDPLLTAGAAYIFRRDEGGTSNWGEIAKLTVSDAEAFDEFGISVAISEDTAIVGAWRDDAGAGDLITEAGAAYVFKRDKGGAGNWGEVAKLTASDAQASDQFGISVAISGGTGVVGAREEDGGPDDPLSNAGAAYVFRESFLRFFIGDLPQPARKRLLITPR